MLEEHVGTVIKSTPREAEDYSPDSSSVTVSIKVVLNTTLIQPVTPTTLDEKKKKNTKQVGEKTRAVVSTRNYRAQTWINCWSRAVYLFWEFKMIYICMAT